MNHLKNEFPISVYPKKLQDIILAYAQATNLPSKFTCVAILLALASAIGSTYELLYRSTYRMFASLYCVFVAQSGVGKTAPLSMAYKPIKNRMEREFNEYTTAFKKYTEYMALSPEEQGKVPKVVRPQYRRRLMDDFTIEKLWTNLSENRRGITIKVEEINGLFKSIGRYNSGNAPDVEFYNSYWSGEDKNVDRVTKEPLHIPSGALTICGNTQPGVISTIFGKGNDQNGMVARLLFCCMPNAKIPRQEKQELDSAVLDEYHTIIDKLLDIEMMIDLDGKEVPRPIKLTPEAAELYQNWHNDIFIPLAEEESRPLYREAFIKLSQYLLRLALIIQLADFATGEDSDEAVGVEAVKAGILLFNFYAKELDYIYGVVYDKDLTLMMTEKQRNFYNSLRPDGIIVSESLYEIGEQFGLTKDMVKKFIFNKKYFTRTEPRTYRRNYVGH